MPSRKLVLLGLLGAVTLSVPALAQQGGSSTMAPYPPVCAASSVTQKMSDEAHGFYNGGRIMYDEGNYDGAIGQFREAYKRDCSKHDLLIIISRSYELKGDKAEAVKALEMYLDRVKDSPDAQTHRTKIENLKHSIATQPPPPPSATAAPTVTATATPPPPEVREHTIPPWLVVGVGGAAVVVGVALLATSASKPANCETSGNVCKPIPGETPAQLTQEQNDAEKSERKPAGYILVIAGGAAVAGGLLWHFLEPTGPVTQGTLTKPRIDPLIAPGFGGLSLGGTF